MARFAATAEAVHERVTLAELEIEARAQIRKALHAGIDVMHLDSHNGVNRQHTRKMVCEFGSCSSWRRFLAAPAQAAVARSSGTIEEPTTAFVDVAVVPMDREHVLPHQTVVIRAGRIATIGPTPRVHVPDSALRIDGHGKYLMPALADMHSHPASLLDLMLYGERCDHRAHHGQ
jgi:hypothetical protein